jgi:hypothetical protein
MIDNPRPRPPTIILIPRIATRARRPIRPRKAVRQHLIDRLATPLRGRQRLHRARARRGQREKLGEAHLDCI